MNRTSERTFGNAIEDVLLSSGFQQHTSKEFDRENAIFPTVALNFIQTTQPKVWDKLELLHGEKTGIRRQRHWRVATAIEKFQLVFDRVLESLFIERMELNEDLFARYMNDPEFKELVFQWLGQQVYARIPKNISYRSPKKPS